MSNFSAFSRKFALPYWRWFIAGIVTLAVTNLLTLEIPQIAKKIINGFLQDQLTPDLRGYAALLIALGFMTILFRTLSRIFLFWPGRKIEANSRGYLFDRMMRLPQAFYERFGMGELISRLTNDISQLRAFYAFGVLQMLNLTFLVSFTISKMISIHPTLTILALAPLVLMILLMKGVFTKFHQLSLAKQVALGKLTNRVTEAFVNVHAIKANAVEDVFIDRAQHESEEVYRIDLRYIKLEFTFWPLISSMLNISQVLIVFYGGYETINGRLTIGDILAFNIYLAYLSFPLSAFGIIMSLYQRARAALARITEVEEYKTEEEQTAPRNEVELNPSSGLEVRHLYFRYPRLNDDHEPFAINKISLHISPGKRIGIFGPIGSGKTTLFNLMTRLIEPPAGTIFLNGTDITQISPEKLRREIGYVQQTSHLFSASVRENLLLGAESSSDEQLERAAADAQILKEIERFEGGWHAEIGEKGLRLSGGQKQRLALARFLLRRPPILLLDDVLSAVDQQTERRMVDALKKRTGTTIIATHRTLALQECDEVYIMDEGRILDHGSFSNLAEKYAAMFESQEAAHEKK